MKSFILPTEEICHICSVNVSLSVMKTWLLSIRAKRPNHHDIQHPNDIQLYCNWYCLFLPTPHYTIGTAIGVESVSPANFVFWLFTSGTHLLKPSVTRCSQMMRKLHEKCVASPTPQVSGATARQCQLCVWTPKQPSISKNTATKVHCGDKYSKKFIVAKSERSDSLWHLKPVADEVHISSRLLRCSNIWMIQNV